MTILILFWIAGIIFCLINHPKIWDELRVTDLLYYIFATPVAAFTFVIMLLEDCPPIWKRKK